MKNCFSAEQATVSADSDTVTRILDVAERLAMTRGFARFSYADIAAELSLTKPALHYHFRTKALLGEALVKRYSQRFFEQLERVDAQSTDARSRLRSYADIYRAALGNGRMCLCGMLAAEYETLPPAMRAAVSDFFVRNERWLTGVLANGRALDQQQMESVQVTARSIIDTLEGAMLVARAFHDAARFDASVTRLFAEVDRETPASWLPVPAERLHDD